MANNTNKRIEEHETRLALIENAVLRIEEGVDAIKGFMERVIEMQYRLDGSIDQQSRNNKRINDLDSKIEELEKTITEKSKSNNDAVVNLDKKIWKFGIIATSVAGLASIIGSSILSNFVDKLFQ